MPGGTPPERPNVLIFLSDQHSARALGCYGNPQVATPHLDLLAAGGTRFDAAYTACPVCVPGRYALYTGRYVHSLRTVSYPHPDRPAEAPSGPAALSLRERTLAHHFREAGYVTAFVGKLHPVAPHTYGFDYYVDFGHYADFLGPRYETFARGMRAVDSGCGVPWIDTLHGQRGGPWSGAALTPGAPAVFADEADHQEGFVAREAVRFLRAARSEPDGTPFCLVVSFLKPHAPWAPAPSYAARYDPEALALPPEPALPAADDPALPAAVRQIGRRFWQPHETWPLPPPGDPARPAARRRWLAAYYACVTQMDAAAGVVLAELEALALTRNTLVVYTSDHGEMAGEHGLFQKFVLFDGSARVPLIVRCPWLPGAPGARGRRAVRARRGGPGGPGPDLPRPVRGAGARSAGARGPGRDEPGPPAARAGPPGGAGQRLRLLRDRLRRRSGLPGAGRPLEGRPLHRHGRAGTVRHGGRPVRGPGPGRRAGPRRGGRGPAPAPAGLAAGRRAALGWRAGERTSR